MKKKALTEADIRTKFITPALVGANGDKWDLMTQVREEVYFTKGRVIVRGKTVKRGVARRADYILVYKPNIPLALIEAKDNNHAVGDGMPQALDCAESSRRTKAMVAKVNWPQARGRALCIQARLPV